MWYDMLCTTCTNLNISVVCRKCFILPTGLKELDCLQISWLRRIISCESLVWVLLQTIFSYSRSKQLTKRDATATEFKMQVTSAAWLPAATVLKPQDAVFQPAASETHEARNHRESRQTLQKASEMFAETTNASNLWLWEELK